MVSVEGGDSSAASFMATVENVLVQRNVSCMMRDLTHSRQRTLLKKLLIVGAYAHNYCMRMANFRLYACTLRRTFLPASYRLLTMGLT